MAKAALDLSASSLAKEAGVHRNTLVRAEDGSASDTTLRQLREFFESRGIQFISTEDGFHGILYREAEFLQNA
jgi:predicted transcriptional regulator